MSLKRLRPRIRLDRNEQVTDEADGGDVVGIGACKPRARCRAGAVVAVERPATSDEQLVLRARPLGWPRELPILQAVPRHQAQNDSRIRCKPNGTTAPKRFSSESRSCETVFDYDGKRKQAAAIEDRMGAADFWNNQGCQIIWSDHLVQFGNSVGP